MKVPNAEHERRPWRIHELVPDFTLEDVWALPARGGPDDFGTFIEMLGSFDPMATDSRPSRFLWILRDRLGSWLDLGKISAPAADAGALPIPGGEQHSLDSRLPEDLRDSAAGVTFAALPFVPLYRTDREAAAEVSNRTVHGVAHFSWVEREEGDYQAEMAVYVKPRGHFGEAYMALIKPFRYWIVYPALMNQIARAWQPRSNAP